MDRARAIVSEYDHAEVLTPDEYKEFLGLIPSEDHNEEQKVFLSDLLVEYDIISQSTINAFSRSRVIYDTALQALATLRNQALIDLTKHKDRWREHFKTRFLGNLDWV